MVTCRVVAVLLAAGLTMTSCSKDEDSPERLAGEAAASFVQAWQENQSTGIAAADRLIEDLDAELQVTGTSITVPERATCTEDGRACEVAADVTLAMRGIGDWTYDTVIPLKMDQDGAWVVAWQPQIFHPGLTGETSLERRRTVAPRAQILGAGGAPLTAETSVKRISVVPSKVEPRTYRQLADLLDIDAAGLRQQVAAAEPDWFVPVITLRESQYAPIRARLLQVPGVSVDDDVWSLTKSSTWARALIGTVAPATGDTLEQAGPLAAPTDVVGASGLQLAFQQQLAGKPGGEVRLVDARSGAVLDTLFRQRPQPGQPLRTTIDLGVQDAAEAAVAVQDKSTALVAVRARTGEVLASAVGPGIESYNSAFVGQYPPGSTFKIVSAAALLGTGAVTTDTLVPCPASTTVEGKSFKNYDDFRSVSSNPTFAQDIAASCNTAMVSLAGELDDEALSEWAGKLGLGHEWELGVAAFSGDVPPADSEVDQAAAMIGQGKVLASPLAMAMVAAAVDSGQPQTPRLLADDEAAPLEALAPRLADDLQAMMRLTVTDGTAASLDLPGEPVYAKTGTAEIDSDDPSKTHAWIIGFRGDVAFAVLVEQGESGSEDAAPVVREFLQQIPADEH